LAQQSSIVEKHPWTQSWWKVDRQNRSVLIYLVVIHALAILGILLFPLPGWKVFLATFTAAALGGLGTTVGYHRALSHRSVKLNTAIEQILIFFAVFNGSGAPSTWIANHRNHHANADTIDDVSSPRHGGFWWAHLRWIYQWDASSMEKWCPDLIHTRYLFWARIQPYLLVLSLSFGYLLLGWAGFFWLGAIRLVYSLHMQAFVNSLLHLKPGLPEGADSSQNIGWLGPLQITAWGENWHGNHHAHPASAKFSHHWWQVDIGWYVICGLKRLGLAESVRTQKNPG
jgi:stearoyl-CoA desaturase (delta-9 desaturase)